MPTCLPPRPPTLLAMLALACAPAHASEIRDLTPETPSYRDIVSATQRAMQSELRQPTYLNVTMLRSVGAFAGLAADLERPDGTALDFSITPYAADVKSGFFDGPHLWALLGFSDGEWHVLEYDIGPTDAWFISWPENYGADCALMGAGIGNC